MIESSFLCSSLWDSEPFQPLNDELEFSEFDSSMKDIERDSSVLSSCCTTPNGVYNDVSCSSSDYDGLSFDDISPVTDTFISQLLEEENNVVDFSESDLSSLFDVSENCNLPIDDNTVSTKPSPKKAKKSHGYLSTKLWSKMSPKEQLQTLHALSEIVTCQMGIREQIEVIKIIDPSAIISAQDTEFALDSSSLNDAKMKRIQDYVYKHGFSLTNSKKLNSSSSSTFTSGKSSGTSKIFSRKASSRTKKRQKKGKMCTDEDISQKRKLELHGQKEAQSGLFVYEKVIKKLSNPLEEDEDVNILE